jgi:hypothetical protein
VGGVGGVGGKNINIRRTPDCLEKVLYLRRFYISEGSGLLPTGVPPE